MDTEVKKGTKHVSVFSNDFNEEFRLRVDKEINETEANKKKGLEVLRNFIIDENLPEKLADDFLLACLRVSKFDMEKSKERLLKYCETRRRFNDVLFKKLDVNMMRMVMKTTLIGVLPYLDPHGRPIIYGRSSGWTPDICPIEEVARCLTVFLDFLLTLPLTTKCGITLINDCWIEHQSYNIHYFNFIREYHPALSATPIRLGRGDYIRAPFFVRCFLAAIRPLIPNKIRSRISVHGTDVTATTLGYDPSILPNELGGTLGPVNNDFFLEQFVKHVEKVKSQSLWFDSETN